MDPYRSNPYGGYRPPGGGYRPPMGMPPQPYGMPPGGGPPGPYGAPRPPMSHPRPPAPYLQQNGPPQQQHQETNKLTTVFVGAIAPGIDDAWLEKLLKACGTLVNWKRTKDPSGNPKGFGFAEYEDADSVLRALKVLGGDEGFHDGLLFTGRDESQTQKKLIVKADDNVRNHLEEHKTRTMQTSSSDELDTKAMNLVTEYVNAINDGRVASDMQDGKSAEETPAKEGADDDNDEQDIITKELASFRERAAQRDEERRRQDDHPDDHRRHDRRHHRGSPEPDRHRRGGRNGHRQEFTRGSYERPDEDEDISDTELERRREEKHEREAEHAFRQREQRVEKREMMQLEDYDRERARVEEEDYRRAQNKQYWSERLADYDDEKEIDSGHAEYYSNRSRWRKHRMAFRRREEELDEEDRRAEALEKEEEARRAEEEKARMQQDDAANLAAVEAPKIAIKPTKLSFNTPIKRISAMGGAEDDEDDEQSGKKRRVLVPLDYGDDVALDDASHLDNEERVKLVKELIDSIPSSEQELWNWPVKYDQVDEGLMESKLRPFVTKKIVELVGEEEQELISFILDFVGQKRPPTELVQELEVTLDQDALVFTMKFWRALIFETERKARRL
ncbi:hypothetical protein BCR43DRAFT_478816 [Syncephalastrum racemosum]|uniref:PWI domain-containing protein n=1 Tax=Syncephalastrum racemosum TaxID=13706 RepID=A0A1X2H5E3_SYNRA|nr:hypothetical protein BCR43DRAFT_478816 [Syncephalastrum racemosum]